MNTKNQTFTFSGLNWMKPNEVENLKTQLDCVNIPYEISYKPSTGLQVFIKDYDIVLDSQSDDSAVTFGYIEQTMSEDDYHYLETGLKLITIDDEMHIMKTEISYNGFINRDGEVL